MQPHLTMSDVGHVEGRPTSIWCLHLVGLWIGICLDDHYDILSLCGNVHNVVGYSVVAIGALENYAKNTLGSGENQPVESC